MARNRIPVSADVMKRLIERLDSDPQKYTDEKREKLIGMFLGNVDIPEGKEQTFQRVLEQFGHKPPAESGTRSGGPDSYLPPGQDLSPLENDIIKQMDVYNHETDKSGLPSFRTLSRTAELLHDENLRRIRRQHEINLKAIDDDYNRDMMAMRDKFDRWDRISNAKLDVINRAYDPSNIAADLVTRLTDKVNDLTGGRAYKVINDPYGSVGRILEKGMGAIKSLWDAGKKHVISEADRREARGDRPQFDIAELVRRYRRGRGLSPQDRVLSQPRSGETDDGYDEERRRMQEFYGRN